MKVGDYVRTKGYITKIDSCTCWKAKNQWYISYKLPNGSDCASAVTDEFKISPNIIDLIEVGDYVNGYKVTMLEDEYYDDATDSVKKIKDKEKIKIILGNEEQFYGVYAKDIKSIVTREMFESMEYKVGDE